MGPNSQSPCHTRLTENHYCLHLHNKLLINIFFQFLELLKKKRNYTPTFIFFYFVDRATRQDMNENNLIEIFICFLLRILFTAGHHHYRDIQVTLSPFLQYFSELLLVQLFRFHFHLFIFAHTTKQI